MTDIDPHHELMATLEFQSEHHADIEALRQEHGGDMHVCRVDLGANKDGTRSLTVEPHPSITIGPFCIQNMLFDLTCILIRYAAEMAPMDDDATAATDAAYQALHRAAVLQSPSAKREAEAHWGAGT